MSTKFAAMMCSVLLGLRVATALECNDDNLCTVLDTCVEDDCIGTPVVCQDDGNACTIESCNPSTGACESLPRNCDDYNPCTNDSCNPSTGCVHTPNIGASCDDDLQCTTNDTCRDKFPAIRPFPCNNTAECALAAGGGTCDPALKVCLCNVDSECNNSGLPAGFVCRHHACVQKCSTPNDCLPYPPANPICAENEGVNICHFNLTTLDTAVCVGDPVAAGTTCTDVFGTCTENDRCQLYQVDLGKILTGQDSSLDFKFPLCRGDNRAPGTPCGGSENPCYPAACQLFSDPDIPEAQVAMCIPNPVVCPQDSNLCNYEYCNPATGLCDHLALACGDECETEVCDPNSGCVPKPNGTACNDGNECTGNAQCVDGVCAGQAAEETPTVTMTVAVTTTPTETVTVTATATVTATQTATGTATATPTLTATSTITESPTVGPSDTPTSSPTITQTRTATSSPTLTQTSAPTSTPSVTSTQTQTATATQTATETETRPPTPTRTRRPIPVVSSPMSTSGMLLIACLAASMLVALTRRAWIHGR